MTKKQQYYLSILSCFLVTLIFSIHFVIAKKMLTSHHPMSLTTLRGIIAGSLILFMFRKHIRISDLKKHKWILFAIGALGFFGNQLLFMTGLKMTSSLNASIISNAVPLVTAGIGISIGVEKFVPKRVLGIIIGFVSVLYLIFKSQNQIEVSPLGDFLIFSNMFVFALALIMIKRLTAQGVHFAVITGIMMLVGGSLASLIAGNDTISLFSWSMVSLPRVGMFIFEVLISTVVAYLFNFYALKNLAPSLITVFIYLQPFITAGTQFFFDSKIPQVDSWVAFIGIIIGGVLTLYSSRLSSSSATNKSYR